MILYQILKRDTPKLNCQMGRAVAYFNKREKIQSFYPTALNYSLKEG